MKKVDNNTNRLTTNVVTFAARKQEANPQIKEAD